MIESNALLRTELAEIEVWEQSQKDLWFWEKIGRIPFVILDRLTPKFIHEKLGLMLHSMGEFIQSGGKHIISERSIFSQLASETGDQDEIKDVSDVARLPLSVMDKTADGLIASRRGMAAVQGATTGIGGIFTLAIDIPALMGLSLKILQEIALCYGYDPNDKQERVFIVKCLQFASSDIVGKKAILDELTRTTQQDGGDQMISQLQGWREVVASYRDSMGWKKLFQMVPIVGILFGAWINKGTVTDVAEVGKMLYKKRRILQRLDDGAAIDVDQEN